MPVSGKLYVRELRSMYRTGGADVVRAFYPKADSFLLILSDDSGFPAYVSWTPSAEETGEFEITSHTPTEEQKYAPTKRIARKPVATTPFTDTSVVVPLRGEAGSEKDVISVGRGGFNDIKLTSLSVSSMQSSFIKDPDGTWGLMDRNSRNGTYIDGLRLEANRLYQAIASGREIAFADIKCVFLDFEGVLDVCRA